MVRPLILDLCAGTGAWSEPYVKAGYDVERLDVLTCSDVRLRAFSRRRPHGILAAPPCTVFSYARNRYEPSDAELCEALSVVDACLRAVVLGRPAWWALENPINKLRRYLGPPAWRFRQWEYGDAGEKPTGLWGTFHPPLPMRQLGQRTRPSTFRTARQNADSADGITPPHFARAFFEANP